MKGSNSHAARIDVDAHDVFGSPNRTGTPERNLLMATLERAILDFVGNKETEIAEAEQWIFAEEKEKTTLFSFRWVCEQLDLDAKKVAEIIRDMPKRGSRRVAPWYFKDEAQLCA